MRFTTPEPEMYLEDPWPVVDRIALTGEERQRCALCEAVRLCIPRGGPPTLWLCRVCREVIR